MTVLNGIKNKFTRISTNDTTLVRNLQNKLNEAIKEFNHEKNRQTGKLVPTTFNDKKLVVSAQKNNNLNLLNLKKQLIIVRNEFGNTSNQYKNAVAAYTNARNIKKPTGPMLMLGGPAVVPPPPKDPRKSPWPTRAAFIGGRAAEPRPEPAEAEKTVTNALNNYKRTGILKNTSNGLKTYIHTIMNRNLTANEKNIIQKHFNKHKPPIKPVNNYNNEEPPPNLPEENPNIAKKFAAAVREQKHVSVFLA